MKTKKG